MKYQFLGILPGIDIIDLAEVSAHSRITENNDIIRDFQSDERLNRFYNKIDLD